MFATALRFIFAGGGDEDPCSCPAEDGPPSLARSGKELDLHPEPTLAPLPKRLPGPIAYSADISQRLIGDETRAGDVWHLRPEDGKTFEKIRLSLYNNGMLLRPLDATRKETRVAWSPFSLVQACRLHTAEADKDLTRLRLFKISVFQHGSTHFFATEGPDAVRERARWCADVSRSIRILTQSLFPSFAIRSEPLPGAIWTSTRLLAGYLLLCDDQGVMVAYVELHAHWDCMATFAAYEDETCTTQVVRLGIDQHTCVSERVGVDCSCFSFEGYHFTARTCSEKMLWLRCISNLKVKLRHQAPNPTPAELTEYRQAVLESAKTVRVPDPVEQVMPLLPRRLQHSRGSQPPGSMTNRSAVSFVTQSSHTQVQPSTALTAISPSKRPTNMTSGMATPAPSTSKAPAKGASRQLHELASPVRLTLPMDGREHEEEEQEEDGDSDHPYRGDSLVGLVDGLECPAPSSQIWNEWGPMQYAARHPPTSEHLPPKHLDDGNL